MNKKHNKKEDFVKKQIKLSREFDEYAAKHQKIFKGMPRVPWIVIVDLSDPQFSRKIILEAKKSDTTNLYVVEKSKNQWSAIPFRQYL